MIIDLVIASSAYLYENETQSILSTLKRIFTDYACKHFTCTYT